MKKAILTIGVSASGKTNWAEKWVESQNNITSESDPDMFPRWVNINRDDIRFSLLGVRDWSKWNWKREKDVTAIQEGLIEKAVEDGCNIVISDTNLTEKYRESRINQLESLGYEVELKEFDVSFEEACKRDALRSNGVGYSVIAKQLEQWEQYKNTKAYQHDTKLETCAIFDIDGTLAHMDGRGAFDWGKVGEDYLDTAVSVVLKGVFEYVDKVFLFSGRDEICREQTEQWLLEYGVEYDTLIMRTEGDVRKDTIVKREMFDEVVDRKYNVLMVVDDRPSVCRMWRTLGLKVLQVGNPYIEF